MIKEFIGNNVRKAVEDNPEMAGRLLCEAIGYQLKQCEVGKKSWLYSDNGEYWWECKSLVHSFGRLFYIQNVVIEKVGAIGKRKHSVNAEVYGKKVLYKYLGKVMKTSSGYEIATADAKTRLCALLLALAEVE